MPGAPQYTLLPDGRAQLPSGQIVDLNSPAWLATVGLIKNGGGQGFTSGPDGQDTQAVRDLYAAYTLGGLSNPNISDPSTIAGYDGQGTYYNDGSVRFDDPALQARYTQIQNAYDQNDKALDNLEGYQGNYNNATWQNNQRIGQIAANQNANDARFINQSQALTDQLGGYRDTANQQQTQLVQDYNGQLANLSNYNTGLVNNLGGLYGDLSTPLQSQVVWQGDLVSQAAQADPQALAAQNNALGFLSGAMNGSLDYESQAALAYADPRYLAMRDQGLSDLYGVSQGSKDVLPGQLDPEAYGAAMDALHQFGDLTDPRVTDAERFLYEQARQAQELDERALSAARMSDLRRRGMAGSGAELTQGALDSQRISQNRLLSDLGAGANAINRSMTALQGYGNLSSVLNNQANALASANSDRQLSALGSYTAGSAQAADASFDQAYKRGVAADTASANNQATRLQGGIAYGNQANAMQDDAFNRGMAADQTAQFNRAQSIDVAKYNSDYAQKERDAQWSRGVDLTNTGLTASDLNARNAASGYQANNSLIGDTYNRNRDVVGMQDTTNLRQNVAGQQQTNRDTYLAGLDQDLYNGIYGQQASNTQARMNNNAGRLGATTSNYDIALGANAANQASEQARKLADAQNQTSILWGLIQT